MNYEKGGERWLLKFRIGCGGIIQERDRYDGASKGSYITVTMEVEAGL